MDKEKYLKNTKEGGSGIIPNIMNKMKKLLPFLVTAMLIFTGIPVAAFAAEEPSAPADAAAAESVENTGEAAADTSSTEEASETSAPTDSTAASEESTEPAEETSTEASEEDPENQIASDKVVTLGENLNDAQKASMYDYFGTSADQVKTIVVTHSDEVK